MPGNDDGKRIEILAGSTPIDERWCPLHLLPDNRTGALWRGLVYPLLGDQKIDVEGEAFPLSLCRPNPNLAISPDTVLIEGVGEAWLLITGPAATANWRATQLKQLGIEVLRVGRYLGEPDGDLVADWFVRFAKPSNLSSVRELIGTVSEPSVTPSVEVTRARVLEVEIAQARAKSAMLEAKLARLAAEAARREGHAGESAVLQEAIQREQVLRAEAEAARELAERALAELSREVPRLARSGGTGELEAVFQVFLPRLLPLRDSLSVIATTYESRGALFRALLELQDTAGRLPPAWKAVQGIAGWWERHIGTGRESTGRLYARLEAESARYEVLVSEKREQARDIAWMRLGRR